MLNMCKLAQYTLLQGSGVLEPQGVHKNFQGVCKKSQGLQIIA